MKRLVFDVINDVACVAHSMSDSQMVDKEFYDYSKSIFESSAYKRSRTRTNFRVEAHTPTVPLNCMGKMLFPLVSRLELLRARMITVGNTLLKFTI